MKKYSAFCTFAPSNNVMIPVDPCLLLFTFLLRFPSQSYVKIVCYVHIFYSVSNPLSCYVFLCFSLLLHGFIDT